MGLTAVGIGSAVGGLGSAIIGSNAANKAANAQAGAAQNALNTQLAMFNTTQQNLAPYMDFGKNALGNLSKLQETGVFGQDYPNYQSYGDFKPVTAENLESTPGYTFTRDQGMRAINNQMSAAGLAGSGAQMKGIADYVTGLASNTYDKQVANNINNFNTGLQGRVLDYTTGFNSNQTEMGNLLQRYLSMANVGQNSAAQVGNFSNAAAGQIGNNMVGIGNAQAAGAIGQANAISGGINAAIGGGTNAYMTNWLLQNYGPRPNAAPTPPPTAAVGAVPS